MEMKMSRELWPLGDLFKSEFFVFVVCVVKSLFAFVHTGNIIVLLCAAETSKFQKRKKKNKTCPLQTEQGIIQ